MNDFSTTLKTWRAARRYSQLDLAMQAEISARHLSFLETGRARPSREMVERLGEALELPLVARNQMLTHAGFAVRYATRDWNDEAMAPIRRAVSRQSERHMPYPGVAVDRVWTIRQANTAAIALFAPFGVSVGGSLLDLMMSEILPRVVENWPEVAHQAALRLRTESAAQGVHSRVRRSDTISNGRSIGMCADIETSCTDGSKNGRAAAIDVCNDLAVRHTRGLASGRSEDRTLLPDERSDGPDI